MAALVDVATTFQNEVRRQLRGMGDACSVQIEPPTQGALLDLTLTTPGVVFAGVPGGKSFHQTIPTLLPPLFDAYSFASVYAINSWW